MMSSAATNQTASIFQEAVTIHVGPENVVSIVHSQLLLTTASHFNATGIVNVHGPDSRSFRLARRHPAYITLFVQWLYKQHVSADVNALSGPTSSLPALMPPSSAVTCSQ
jgi:hypothetical protein